MAGELILFFGIALGFASAARNWLAIRMKDGKRCIPKIFLWRGTRNGFVTLGAIAVLIYTTGGLFLGLGAPGPKRFVSGLILFVLGVGLGNGLSNVFGGTLSFVTKGPFSGGDDDDDETQVNIDEFGQIK